MPSRLDPAQRYEDALAAIERLLAERAVLVEEQEAEPLAIAAAQTLVAEIEREVRIAEETLSAAMESMVAQGLKPACPRRAAAPGQLARAAGQRTQQP